MVPRIELLSRVKITGGHLLPHIVIMLHAARETAPALVDNVVWVTSANDGKHMRNSKHYSDEAFDIRVKNIKGNVQALGKEWADRIAGYLAIESEAAGYDVVFEGDHIHIEYDPK